ncbi:MFS transporter permease [Knoellia koreensis]|uniref:MFS transporter permease n=1 Tax=Knoellia koreensis TaxID=2730921 RepID=A0A849H755_9MICO|nr:MFS transporter permease [Knoellia sp. DB2414S]NNM45596.1 MFS transporter permease [Knoellia sp. DB2414S]
MSRLRDWLFTPMPLARVAWLRILVFAFVVIDVLGLHTSGWYHGWADPVWYEPLVMGKVLHLPAASVLLVQVLKWGTVAAALAALTGRAPRLLGWAVAIGWTWYQYVAFAYGKVDHDRADFVVAMALLPTVGLAHLSDRRRSEAAGFALRAVQLAAIATYFLSAWAKVRFGGWDWVNSATMVRAVVRRGTPWAQWLLEVPWTLHWFQWVLFTAELTAPVIFFLSEKWRRRVVGAWFVFHAMTYAAITIAFWPHLVMMLAFLPLEEYAAWLRARFARWRSRGAAPVAEEART